MQKEYIEDEMEISLKELITIILNGKKIIAVTTAIFLLFGVVVSFFIMQEKFESTSLLQMTINQESSQLTYDAVTKKVMSNRVLQGAIEELDLKDKKGKLFSIEKLKKMITVANPEKTNLIEIKVEDNDSERAAVIANKITDKYILQSEKSNLLLIKQKSESELEQLNSYIESSLMVINQYIEETNAVNQDIGGTDIIIDQELENGITYSLPLDTPSNQIARSVTSIEIGQMKIQIASAIAKKSLLEDKIAKLNLLLEANDNQIHDGYEKIIALFGINTEIVDAQVVSIAVSSEEPVSPNKLLNLAIALMVGFMISTLYVIFRNYWNNTEIS